MLIISDTSPITNLIQIGYLQLLQQLFEETVIPSAVFEELSNYEQQREILEQQNWIIVKSVTNPEAVRQLEQQLDLGEAEAITLAKELKADFLIIDERKGRQIAEAQGLKVVGLLGILIQGKKKGYITYLKLLLDKLVYEVGFRVNRKLYDRILTEVGKL